jgi:hypothetical protein
MSMFQKIHRSTLAGFLALAGLSSMAAADAVISWEAPQAIAGAGDVSTAGVTYGAWAPGNSSDRTVNGVTFAKDPSSIPGFSTTGIDFSADAFGSPTPDNGGLNASYNALLADGKYSQTGSTASGGEGTMTFNVTAGTTYEVQFWVNDARTQYPTIHRSETVSGAVGGTSLPLNFLTGSAPFGHFVIGDFVAVGSTEIIKIDPSAADNQVAQVDAFQVRVVPLPSALLGGLMLLGACGLWELRRGARQIA